MHRFDAVVFDLDGTLLDSRVAVIGAVGEGIREVAIEAGLEPPEISEAVLMAALGKPSDEYFRQVLPPTLGHLAARVKEAATRNEVAALAEGRGRLFPGVLAALDRLADAGVRLAAISNAQAPYFRAALEHTGLADRFQHTECHEELPPASAPPFKLALLQRALDRLGTEPQRALMVGDRGEDIDAGRRAGCSTLAIPFGFGGATELASADFELAGFDRLPGLVGI